jgi:Uma2 family endonuclease
MLGTMAGFRRFSVDEYHRLIELGILNENDKVELIEGYLVLKMPRNSRHDGIFHRAFKRLTKSLPAGWDIRLQSAISLADSEPEPDLAVVWDDPGGYLAHHPGAADVGLVVEVSDTTLAGDRSDKGRVYSRAGIAYYWIINLPDNRVEVYSSPSGPSTMPAYAQRQDLLASDAVSLVLGNVACPSIPVRDLLP